MTMERMAKARASAKRREEKRAERIAADPDYAARRREQNRASWQRFKARLAAAAAVTIALLAVAPWSAAHAELSPRVDEHDLVRVIVAEAGPHLTADAPAIMHVLERRGARVGRSAADVARRYSPALRAPRGYWGRTVAAASPHELEAVAPGIVALVRGWLRGERAANTCPGADHWGAPTGADWERATRAGWRRVRCTRPTANAFWSDR